MTILAQLSDQHIRLPPDDEGELDLAWLEAALDEEPTIVAMHHPPILTGIGGLDEIGLVNRDALAGLRRSQVVPFEDRGDELRLVRGTTGSAQRRSLASSRRHAP